MHSFLKTRRTQRALVLVAALSACRGEPTVPSDLDPPPTSMSSDAVQSDAAAPGFSFQTIGNLHAAGSAHISADGKTVAGTLNGRAVRWTAAAGAVPLGALPGGDGTSIPWALSSDGSVIVGSASSARGTEGFRWTASTGMVALGDLPGSGSLASYALGVSADGSIVVGQSSRSSITRAFRWTAATGMTSLGSFPGGDGVSTARAISLDGTVIVGSSHNAAGQEEAFRWTASGGLTPLGFAPGASFSRGDAVSADGSVIGGSGITSIAFEAFRWTAASRMVGLGTLDTADFASTTLGVNADGNVLVGLGSGASDFFGGDAFVWFPRSRMIDLRKYMLNHGVSAVQGWKFGYASSVSADGRTIVGAAIDPQGGNRTFLVTIDIDDNPPPPPPPTSDSTELLRPTSVSVLAGTLVSGGVTQLQTSDNAYIRLQSSGRNPMQLSLTGRASQARASELRFSLEAAATGSITRQNIELFDFTTRSWVPVSQGTATTTDATLVFTAGRPARFIEAGTLRMMARVTFVPSGGKRETTSARVDAASWTRIP